MRHVKNSIGLIAIRKSSKPGSRSCAYTRALNRRAAHLSHDLDREPRHADDHAVGGNRRGLPVTGQAPAAWQAGAFDHGTRRHHLVRLGRRHHELAGRLVMRVIDHWQPVTASIGEVVAEEDGVAVLVGADDQAVGGHAGVPNREGAAFAGRGRAIERDPDPIRLVREGERNAAARHS